ncbi:type II toxin-antitoxin system Phd/YefM family antitoxin [Lapidilactobacillus bayanensis]|uniref:type II toxin-antitoxin system Phd/YefM family antitoxin n=1 Tax=Lapidilactobacillus bayanensis TaxID=2485998 RepID=UPI000F79914B|nr:type II toxin-antitoxin system Phd/YefM family antitoxin [Lapidilactobacillus bayanensis]
MEAVGYTNFRNNLKKYIKQVNDDADTLVITSNSDPDEQAVLMSKRDYDAMKETMYIMNNPSLVSKIRQGLKQIDEHKTQVHELLTDYSDD